MRFLRGSKFLCRFAISINDKWTSRTRDREGKKTGSGCERESRYENSVDHPRDVELTISFAGRPPRADRYTGLQRKINRTE